MLLSQFVSNHMINFISTFKHREIDIYIYKRVIDQSNEAAGVNVFVGQLNQKMMVNQKK